MTNPTIRLRKLPSGGTSRVHIESGTSIAQFVADNGLESFDIMCQGETIAKANWANTFLAGGERVSATKSMKGA
jgi:hypothetical protein